MISYFVTAVVYQGCRIPIPHSKLNISVWREKLLGYEDYADHKGQVLWLTKSLFIRTFRSLALTAGDPDPAAYSGHSFRRGGASWAFQAGVPGEMIQVLGDWASDAYKRYLEFNMQNKLELHSLFSLRLP